MVNGLRSRLIARFSILIFLAMNGVADLAHHHDAPPFSVVHAIAPQHRSSTPNHPLSEDFCPICQYLATVVSLPIAPTGMILKPVAYEFANFGDIINGYISPRSVLSSRAPPMSLSPANAFA